MAPRTSEGTKVPITILGSGDLSSITDSNSRDNATPKINSPNISAGTEINEPKEDLDQQPSPILDDLISFIDGNLGDLSSVTDSNSRDNPTPKINIPNISAGTEINEQKKDLDQQPSPILDDLISLINGHLGDLSSVTDSNSRDNATPKINILEHYIIITSDSEYQEAVMNSPDRPSEEADQSRDNVSHQVTAEFISNPNQNFQSFVVNVETVTIQAGDSPEDANIEEKLEHNHIVPPSMSGAKHVCFECKKSFAKPCYLTQHNKTYHSGAKPFKCGKCGKRYSCENSLRDHQIKHFGEKSYKCLECPKQFNHKPDLRRHMCVHTGHKPFTCDTCGKGFIREDHMMKHKETHTKKTLKALSCHC